SGGLVFVYKRQTHDLPSLSGWWRGQDIHWRGRAGHRSAEECAADLQVSAFLRNELRTRQVTDYYGGYYGNYGGWRDPWYGYGASYPVTRSYTVQVTVVRVELNDARSGQPVWGNSAEFDSGDSASEQAKALREAVKRALSSYPPG
ncbi:DUF4136 domain-containing protein, partial [Pseudomonas aeruginosa]|nr:DUF4136 domain-containing protein [Pseudomonas aeruginosa]